MVFGSFVLYRDRFLGADKAVREKKDTEGLIRMVRNAFVVMGIVLILGTFIFTLAGVLNMDGI
jgi:hypothetical protein